MLHVLDVVLDPFLEVRAAFSGAIELPESRDAGPHAQPQVAPRRAELVFVIGAGARPHEAHVSGKNVPELRQLIEIRRPEEPAHARDARIVPNENLRPIAFVLHRQIAHNLVRVAVHGAELPASKEA